MIGPLNSLASQVLLVDSAAGTASGAQPARIGLRTGNRPPPRLVLFLLAPHDNFKASSRCNAFSSQGARIQMSRSTLVVKIIGIAFGSTSALGAVVRKP